MGAMWSATVVSIAPNVRHCVDNDNSLVGPALGLMCVPSALGYALMQIGGLIRDIFGSFNLIYYTCSVLLLVGISALEFIAFKRQKSIFNHQSLPSSK